MVLLFQTACKKKDPEPIVARVGSHAISLKAFQTAAERHRHPPAEALLDELIDQQALYQRALEQNIDQDPEILRAWQQLLIVKLREHELEPLLAKAQPTADEIEAYYQSNQQTYTEPAQRRLALITFDCPPHLRPEKKQELHQRAEVVRQQALTQVSDPAPKGFGALAAEHSHHRPSRYRGGDIGWLHANNTRWEPAVIEGAFSLENIGQVSDIIETEHGLFLLKLLERKDAYTKPLAEVRTMIQHKLLLEKQHTLEAKFVENARDSVTIKIYKDVLATYEPPKKKAQPKPPISQTK